MNLDPDDIFAENNDLNILYYSAKKYNVELVLFLLKRVDTNLININSLNNYLKSINLKKIKSTNVPNYLITNKFIKRNISLKSIQFFKEKIYIMLNSIEFNFYNLQLCLFKFVLQT